MMREYTEEQKARKREYYLSHHEQQIASSRLWRANNPDKILLQQQRSKEKYNNPVEKRRRRNLHLIKTYGISLDDYSLILERQGGVCAICKRGYKGTRNGIEIGHHVDHDHATGKVRGVLCTRCNVALGQFGDSTEYLNNAIKYLERMGLDNE